jgi:hypothetical protein
MYAALATACRRARARLAPRRLRAQNEQAQLTDRCNQASLTTTYKMPPAVSPSHQQARENTNKHGLKASMLLLRQPAAKPGWHRCHATDKTEQAQFLDSRHQASLATTYKMPPAVSPCSQQATETTHSCCFCYSLPLSQAGTGALQSSNEQAQLTDTRQQTSLSTTYKMPPAVSPCFQQARETTSKHICCSCDSLPLSQAGTGAAQSSQRTGPTHRHPASNKSFHHIHDATCHIILLSTGQRGQTNRTHQLLS